MDKDTFGRHLLEPTPASWQTAVQNDFPRFLSDHAACERKASALCLSFVAKYSDQTSLIEPMICLAKEELDHYHEVVRLMLRSGIAMGEDTKDPYVNALLKGARHGRQERLLDRLVISALVEARGAERFQILSGCLEDEELRSFYLRLAKSEAGHYRVFLRLANLLFGEKGTTNAVARLAPLESEAMLAVPARPALH